VVRGARGRHGKPQATCTFCITASSSLTSYHISFRYHNLCDISFVPHKFHSFMKGGFLEVADFQFVLNNLWTGQSMFSTSNFDTEVTSAPTSGLRHLMLTSAPSSIEMVISARCKRITCAEVNEIFRNLCRSSCAEVHPCRSSLARLWTLTFSNLIAPHNG